MKTQRPIMSKSRASMPVLALATLLILSCIMLLPRPELPPQDASIDGAIHDSAAAPFVPSQPVNGTGTALAVHDTYNGSFTNESFTLVEGETNVIPVICPFNYSSNLPLRNLEALTVSLASDVVVVDQSLKIVRNGTNDNGSIGIKNNVLAQQVEIEDEGVIKQFSLYGDANTSIEDPLTINITIVRGNVSSTDVVSTHEESFTTGLSAGVDWYAFDIPEAVVDPGNYTIILNTTSSYLLNLYWFKVNDTGNPSEIAYQHDGDGWQAIDGDFSLNLTMTSVGTPLDEHVHLNATVGDNGNTWQDFSAPGWTLTFNESHGGPWIPLNGTVRLAIRTNTTIDVNMTVNATYVKQGQTSAPARSFVYGDPVVNWSFTYNASIEPWSESTVNGTLYTLTVEPDTQAFSFTVPASWHSIGAIEPSAIDFGNVSLVSIDNVSAYGSPWWAFHARSSRVNITFGVEPGTYHQGDVLAFSGEIHGGMTGSGNATVWEDDTTKFFETTGASVNGSSIFESFTVPNASELPPGNYTAAVFVANGTDVAYNYTQFEVLIVPAVEFETAQLDTLLNSTATFWVTVADNGTGAPLSGVTFESSWGSVNDSWWYEETAAGNYSVTINTSTAYTSKQVGEDDTVLFNFSKDGVVPAQGNITLDYIANANISVSTSVLDAWINDTASFYIEFSDNDTGDPVPGVTITSTWGPEGIAWNYTEGPAGNYSVIINTSSTYTNASPGDAENVTFSLFKAGWGTHDINVTLRYLGLASPTPESDVLHPRLNSTVSFWVVLEDHATSDRLAGATFSSTWGPEGEAWVFSEPLADGNYTITVNTSSLYTSASPGDSEDFTAEATAPGYDPVNVTVTFTYAGIGALSPDSETIETELNSTATFSIQFTDAVSGENVSGATIASSWGTVGESWFYDEPTAGHYSITINTSTAYTNASPGDWVNVSFSFTIDEYDSTANVTVIFERDGVLFTPLQELEVFQNTTVPINITFSDAETLGLIGNATVTSSWGDAGVSWIWMESLFVPGRYYIFLNTSTEYTSAPPGGSENVSFTFDVQGYKAETINITLHYLGKGELVAESELVATVVNGSASFWIEFQDAVSSDPVVGATVSSSWGDAGVSWNWTESLLGRYDIWLNTSSLFTGSLPGEMENVTFTFTSGQYNATTNITLWFLVEMEVLAGNEVLHVLPNSTAETWLLVTAKHDEAPVPGATLTSTWGDEGVSWNYTEGPAGNYSITLNTSALLVNATPGNVINVTFSVNLTGHVNSTATITVFFITTGEVIAEKDNIGTFLNATVSFWFLLESTDTSEPMSGASLNSSWGAAGDSWSYVEGAAGNYSVTLNTSTAFTARLPGEVEDVTFWFDMHGLEVASTTVALHYLVNTSIHAEGFPLQVRAGETAFIPFNFSSEGEPDLGVHGLEHFTLLATVDGVQATVELLPGADSTGIVSMNTSLFPVSPLSGSYVVTVLIDLRLPNGTWYAPGAVNGTLVVLPLQVAASLVRMDVAYNETIANGSVAGYELRPGVIPLAIEASKLFHATAQDSWWVPASGLVVFYELDGQTYHLSAEGQADGVYAGGLNMSAIAAPQFLVLHFFIQGDDVEPFNFTFTVQVLPRVRLSLALFTDRDAFIEGREIQIDGRITYTDHLGETRPYATRPVVLLVQTSDGVSARAMEFALVTTADGGFSLPAILLPYLVAGGAVHVTVEVDESDAMVDQSMLPVQEIPIQGDPIIRIVLPAVVVLLVVLPIAIVVFLRIGLPKMKKKKAMEKIKIAKQVRADLSERAAPKLRNAGIELQRTSDIGRAEPMSLMHMAPPEMFDPDFVAIREQGTVFDPTDKIIDKVKRQEAALDDDVLYAEMTLKIGEAVNLEAQGFIEEAIDTTSEVLETAKKHGNDEITAALQIKLKQLEKKKASADALKGEK